MSRAPERTREFVNWDGDIIRAVIIQHCEPADIRMAGSLALKADFLVTRDSDGKHGGYIVDLLNDGFPAGNAAGGFDAFTVAGDFIATAETMHGALSVFSRETNEWR